jgi:LCP family protein required for cell wall assembly
MFKQKVWKPIAVIIAIIEILCAIYFVISTANLGMLPSRYFVLVILCLAVLCILSIWLLFSGIKKKPNLWRIIKRILGFLLAILIVAGSFQGSTMISKLQSTMDTISNTSSKATVTEGVYVLATDRAQDIADAADYTFGYAKSDSNAQQAITNICETVQKKIDTEEYNSLPEAAAALTSGEVEALIMNKAYMSVLTDTDEFSFFDSDTRLIYEVSLSVESGSGFNRTNTSANGSSEITKSPFLVYVSGSDTRNQILDQSRSDVNIIMAVNPTTKQVLLINTPRDYYVSNPAGDGAKDKLTHCGLDGIDCSMEALDLLYDTYINHYIQINFTGFETLIDAIGGITVYSPQDFSTVEGYYYSEGENYLNGAEALSFARERYSFESGDIQRGKNQMEVIRAVIDKMTSSTVILENYQEILNSLQDMMITDFSSSDISSLINMQLSDNAQWEILSYTATGEGGMDTTYSLGDTYVYVMYPDEACVEKIQDLLDRFLEGETLTSADVAEDLVSA